MIQTSIAMKQKDSQTERADMWLPRRRGYGEGKEWEAGVSRCKLLYIERINKKVSLGSTNYIQ